MRRVCPEFKKRERVPTRNARGELHYRWMMMIGLDLPSAIERVFS